jgi:hypothetical protein
MHDHTERGGFSGAIGADESVDASDGHAEGESVHRGVVAEGLGYVFELDSVHAGVAQDYSQIEMSGQVER